MTINQLIKQLQELKKYKSVVNKVMVASDEEWNTVFKDVKVQIDGMTNKVVIYGLDGSQEDY
jgi:VCBS repeat-containing protein